MTQQVDFAFLGILSVLVVLAFVGGRINRIHSRLAKLSSMDAKLDLLLKQAGLVYEPYKGLAPEIVEALRNGQKIQAIKLYRDTTGVGLKEAKDFIEDVQRRGGVG
jgi:hypothetical protein